MGQRANYIVKNNGELEIHYNHWRANSIASDLYLGEKRFLEFVNNCQLNTEILSEPWIEGCVIIDRNNKALYFWSFEFSRDTSVVDFYLKQLAKKWAGWKLFVLKNRMYDAEKVLGIDYISKQELQKVNSTSKEEVLADKVEDWVRTLVIIKEGFSVFITKTGNLNIEKIISYGQDIIPLMKIKPQYKLPGEGEDGTAECIVINIEEKQVYINESSTGLLECCRDLWTGYDLIIGDFGYIEILRIAGIDTSGILLSDEKINEQFSEMVQVNDDFDPFAMAERLSEGHEDVQFNPDFFDNVKPQKSIADKLKIGLKRLFGPK